MFLGVEHALSALEQAGCPQCDQWASSTSAWLFSRGMWAWHLHLCIKSRGCWGSPTILRNMRWRARPAEPRISCRCCRMKSDLTLLTTKQASCTVCHSIAALVDKESSNRVDKLRSCISLSWPYCWPQLETGSDRVAAHALPQRSRGLRLWPCKKPREDLREVSKKSLFWFLTVIANQD